jgi:RNA polymerase sigma-70 factor (ECF subfamily)
MGRHAADRPAPDSGGPNRRPLHADLFSPAPGTAAALAAERRSAEAFEALVEPHREVLHGYVLRLTDGDEDATASVVKETLYRAAQDPSRFPQRPSAVRPWLILTARSVLRDAERHVPPWSEAHAAPEPPAPVGGPPITVLRAVGELSATHREILVELFYCGVSLEDAAAARGMPVDTVKSQLYYAMRALRTVLDQQVADRHGAP